MPEPTDEQIEAALAAFGRVIDATYDTHQDLLAVRRYAMRAALLAYEAVRDSEPWRTPAYDRLYAASCAMHGPNARDPAVLAEYEAASAAWAAEPDPPLPRTDPANLEWWSQQPRAVKVHDTEPVPEASDRDPKGSQKSG